MVTFPISDKAHGNRPFAFEIENAYVEPGTIARVLKDVVGVTHIRQRKLFARPNEIHLEFRFMNRDYVVWEPFGDNSRYWIGPKTPTDSVVSIDLVESAFRRYRPPFYRRLLGDFLTQPFVRHLVGP